MYTRHTQNSSAFIIPFTGYQTSDSPSTIICEASALDLSTCTERLAARLNDALQLLNMDRSGFIAQPIHTHQVANAQDEPRHHMTLTLCVQGSVDPAHVNLNEWQEI